MELNLITIEKPDELNIILGQAHFIKTVEDLHEAMVQAVPGIQFGLAFCEASGPALVRATGTDPELIALATSNAQAIGAGHSFLIVLGAGFFPINVLTTIKLLPTVCGIFCATANQTQVLVAASEQGRGILGVIDGVAPRGVEGDPEVAQRKAFLRAIGYKA